MSRIFSVTFIIFSLILLLYLLLPGPGHIDNFQGLPASGKSTLPGDTWQVPNISAYFSNQYRNFVIPFYVKQYKDQTIIPFLPLRLNYPPEFAFTTVKDQTQSTYLEELVYPLRDSLFVNGLEPFDKDGQARYGGATKFMEHGKSFETKVTLRYYPSSVLIRIIVWIGIVFSFIFLWRLGRKILIK